MGLLLTGPVSGQELARQLRGRNPDLKVVYVSGYSAEIAGRELKLGRGEDFLQKPFGTDGLLQALRNCLDGTA